eukprot:RCo053154
MFSKEARILIRLFHSSRISRTRVITSARACCCRTAANQRFDSFRRRESRHSSSCDEKTASRVWNSSSKSARRIVCSADKIEDIASPRIAAHSAHSSLTSADTKTFTCLAASSSASKQRAVCSAHCTIEIRVVDSSQRIKSRIASSGGPIAGTRIDIRASDSSWTSKPRIVPSTRICCSKRAWCSSSTRNGRTASSTEMIEFIASPRIAFHMVHSSEMNPSKRHSIHISDSSQRRKKCASFSAKTRLETRISQSSCTSRPRIASSCQKSSGMHMKTRISASCHPAVRRTESSWLTAMPIRIDSSTDKMEVSACARIAAHFLRSLSTRKGRIAFSSHTSAGTRISIRGCDSSRTR